ncbi:MAG: nucleoside-diphosphate sugar epimerase/dehydratase [Anaerocolumna sp.]
MNFFRRRNLFIILVDVLIATLVFVGVFWFRQYRNVNIFDKAWLFPKLPHLFLFIALVGISNFIFKTHRNVWRYAHAREYLMLLVGNFIGFASFYIIERCLGKKLDLFVLVSIYAISLLFMFLIRFSHRAARENTQSNNEKITEKSVVIIGAGNAGIHLLDTLKNNVDSNYKVVMFLDDDKTKIGKCIDNVSINGPIMELDEILKREKVDEIILAIPTLDKNKKKEILELCINLDYRIRILPGTLSALESHTVKKNYGKH